MYKYNKLINTIIHNQTNTNHFTYLPIGLLGPSALAADFLIRSICACNLSLRLDGWAGMCCPLRFGFWQFGSGHIPSNIFK